MQNFIYQLDNIIATTTHWDYKGNFTGYDVLSINLSPIHVIIGSLIVIALLTYAIWPKN